MFGVLMDHWLMASLYPISKIYLHIHHLSALCHVHILDTYIQYQSKVCQFNVNLMRMCVQTFAFYGRLNCNRVKTNLIGQYTLKIKKEF